MATEILISSDPWENRVAVLEGGSLAEIYVEREEKVIGSIYKGKVQNVLPGMGASFIDIGLGRNAFLYVDDINRTPLNIGEVEITQGRSGFTITEKVNRGDDVLVQIVKEPRGLKGARVSTNIQLPGRYLILMPTGKYSGVSRKIASADDRNRLKTIMKAIRPEGMATVVRTAAGGVSQAELIADLGVLIRMWHGILETYKRAAAPALIHKDMNLVYKAARDFITPDVDRVLIDDAEEFEKVRDFMRLLGPQYVDRIQHYEGGSSLFKDHKVDEELEKLMRPTIDLPSGGSIVIESTEALTVIDVNSGKFTGGKNLEDTIVRTNVEAAAEIARQVRLRDIGGIIVCDFIDMGSESSRNRVIETLETGLRRDRSRTTIQSFSALGLLEFTRKRIGKDLAGQLRGRCPTCVGIGSVLSPETVAIRTFREVRRLGRDVVHANGKTGDAHAATPAIHIHAAPTVGAQLDFWYEDEMQNLEREIGAKVDVVVDSALHPEKTTIAVGSENGSAPNAGVRVGDEVEVDLLHAKLPNPTSALAVVGNKLVEVENASGAIGHSIRIKIIDIDDEGNILAEPRAPVAQAGAETRKRRRRGGRGRRKPLTAAEQTEQLRELAEEAARGLGARAAVGIGISTSADAEAEAATEPHPTETPIAVVGTDSAAPPYFPESATAAAGTAETGDGKRRRRRRRRRRGAGTGVGTEALAGIPAASAVAQTSEEDDEEEPALVGAAVAASSAAPGVAANGERVDENGVRRRRRRRRRRGRGTGGAGVGTEAVAASAGTPGSVPDRHVFRVSGSGAAEPTGRVAPPEPNRAIARRVAARSAAVAVEAPPKSISAPAEEPKVTRPSRRRPAAAATKEPAPIAATRQRALPAAPVEAPKRATRAKATTTKAAAAPKTAAPKTAAPKAAASKAVAPKAAAKTPAAKTTAAKATAAKTTTAKKAPAKTAGTRLASPKTAAKAPAAKKAPAKKATAAKATASKAAAVKAPAAAKKAPARKATATAAKKTTRKKT